MTLWRDLRFAVRQLRQHPGFSVTILLTLALCIGVNTALFSLVDAVFFRPLPYPQPQRLIMVAREEQAGGASGLSTGQTGLEWELIRDHATFLDSAVFPGGGGGVNLVAAGRAEYIQQQRVSAGFFHVLGVGPLIGREFARAEDVEGGPDLTLLSYSLWQRIFHGDPNILGRTVTLRGAPYTVIGVMPSSFRSDAPGDLWTPVRASHEGEGGGTNFEIIGRLKPGVTLAQASGQLGSITKSVFDGMKLPRDVKMRDRAISLQEGLGSALRPKIKIMWAAVALVLLIGCVNIAGLLLARSAIRSRELATRLAIGASRGRVIRQLLVESVLLATLGGFFGILVGQFALKALISLNPDQFTTWAGARLDLRVLTVMLAISLITSLLFGLFPAFEATAIDLRSALAEAGRGSSRKGRKWRQATVCAEVALGVMLVFAAGLLIRTLAKLSNQPPGFHGDHVLTASLSLQDARYATPTTGLRLFQASLDRIREIPGVASAAVALSLPYQRPLNMNVQAVTGQDLSHIEPITNMTYVTPGFFEVLQIPVQRGRLLAESDTASSAKVAVVNQAFLAKYLRHAQAPLGSQVKLGDIEYQIVGIVGNVPEQNGWGPYMGPLDEFAEVYVTAAQFPPAFFSMVNTFFSPNWIVRTHGTVPGLPDAMRNALQIVDPTLPFSSFASMTQVRSQSLSEQRYQATLFSSLAGLALLLAALGVYGLTAQSVTQRTREMGIRLALGATRRNIVSAVVVPSIRLALAGIGAGLLMALLAARFLRSMIWGVSTADPVTLVTVCLLLLLIAGLSSLWPAARLLRLDPALTLRDE